MKKVGLVWIMGNGQDYTKYNGFQARQREKERKYRCEEGVEVYECLTWDADMRNVAAMLHSDGIRVLIAFGHSHGIGKGFLSLAKEIRKLNKRKRKEYQQRHPSHRGKPSPEEIQILAVGGCDGVDRWRYLPTSDWLILRRILWAAQAWSLTPFMTINIPDNVQHLYGIRQTNRRPKGHEWSKGKIRFKPDIVNIDPDGARLVHHDADTTKGERDIDESTAWRGLEDYILTKHVDPFLQS